MKKNKIKILQLIEAEKEQNKHTSLYLNDTITNALDDKNEEYFTELNF